MPWTRWDRATSGFGSTGHASGKSEAAATARQKQQLGAQFGAFLAGVDMFDPAPFGLSPQARFLDFDIVYCMI